MKIKKGTIIRTVCLIVALSNQVLTVCGKNPLPFSEEEVYEGVSVTITVVTALVAWWKNNSFTPKAIWADKILHGDEC